MRYLGGKHYQANGIVKILEGIRQPGQRFVDACCGALYITAKMSGERVANDACLPLMNLFRGWQGGWRPPAEITKDEYNAIKSGPRDPKDPLTAFAGFGLGFGGHYFGSYSRGWRIGTGPALGEWVPGASNVGDYCAKTARTLEKKMANFLI